MLRIAPCVILALLVGCSANPAPHPTPPPATPTPPITLPPSTQPTPEPCPLVVNAEHRVGIKMDLRRGSAGAVWLDVTYEYYYGVNPDGSNAGPCVDPITGSHRRWCDLGVDGGDFGVICQNELVGNPKFSSLSPNLILVPGFRNNFNLAQVFGLGTASACSSKVNTICVETVVQ
jgi:hypothetical protein